MTEQIHHHMTANAHMRKKHIVLNNLLGGLAWGVGSVLGATVIVALLLSVLSLFNFIPIIGGLVSNIVNTVNTREAPTQFDHTPK